MKKSVAVSLFFAAFFAVTLTSCDGPLQGDYRTIVLEGIENIEEAVSTPRDSGYTESDITDELDDAANELGNLSEGETVQKELNVAGFTCTVTLRKDGTGYNVEIGGVNLTNEYALKKLLLGMQQSLPGSDPIYLDFSGCSGEYMPSIIGQPVVDKTRFVSVTLPDTVTELYQAPTTGDKFVRTFDGFTNLETVTALNVKEISKGAFEGLANLKEVYIPKAKSIGASAFKNCSSLTTLTVDKEKITVIESEAFMNCQSLEKIDFPNATIIYSRAFSGCSSLISTTLEPLGLDPQKVTAIYSYAFQSCTSIEEVSFPKIARIEMSTFEGCTNLKVVSFSGLGKTEYGYIGSYFINSNAFKNCSALNKHNSFARANMPTITTENINDKIQSYGNSDLIALLSEQLSQP